jgi:hypothetical protein
MGMSGYTSSIQYRPVLLAVLFNILVIQAALYAEKADPREEGVICLAGQWRFQLDPDKKGIEEKWFQTKLNDTARLPGTTDENQKGIINNERHLRYLSRIYIYKGSAWYQKDLQIPDSWAGKHITLLLERTKYNRVWIDDKYIGTQNSLSAPHIYDLSGSLSPGKHVLTIMVDNSVVPPTGNSHAVSEDTQTNWNGIVGKIQLRATDPVWIDDVEIYPDIKKKIISAYITIGNISGQAVGGRMQMRANSVNSKQPHSIAEKAISFSAKGNSTVKQIEYPMGEDFLLWDEFSPIVYQLNLTLKANVGGNGLRDTIEVTFGMRDFAAKGTQFVINGRTTFLRGKLDCCVFPLTGYAPMDKDGWLRVFEIAKSYGINHYRFHSWCPPEAAFDAADELGVYLQPELPNWHAFRNPKHDDYMEAEGYRILNAYGNHPSFVMFALGNELRGKREVMAKLVAGFRNKDPRHLYAQGSNNYFDHPTLADGDDYWTSFATSGLWKGHTDRYKYGKFVRGSYDQHTRGHVNNLPPSTMVDYRDSIAGIPIPVVSHEIASYQVFPNFKEIKKYTGILRARNFEVFRERLTAKHMLDQADDFFRASGALSVICHREDVEAALRTPGFGGFQMLDLQDFPGQGTALVGILDAFMDSKGLITPQAWREFCSATVPLLRMKKYTWSTDDVFSAGVEVAHYGPGPLKNAVPAFSIRDRQGKQVAAGRLSTVDIPQGALKRLGRITRPLKDIQTPQKLQIEISLEGTEYANHYDFWVYPEIVDTWTLEETLQGTHIKRAFDDQARYILNEGGKVLLLPEPYTIKHSIAGAFQPDYWCYPMFKKNNPPGSLGILCDPQHPALAAFPTEFHGNWQWWHIVKDARPIILDETSPDFRPIVQVIDNFERNHKLGLIFEAKVSKGKLLVCASNLLAYQDKPEVRQLLHSLLAYINSNDFDPQGKLDVDRVQHWFEQ